MQDLSNVGIVLIETLNRKFALDEGGVDSPQPKLTLVFKETSPGKPAVLLMHLR